MSFEPSSYQKAILNFIDSNNGNLLVDAKAGSGKTSTLCLIADKIINQDKKCLFLAFNKSIVQELQSRIISDNVQIKTLHSLGLTFLRSYLYKKHSENYILEVDQHDDRIKEWVQNSFAQNCDTEFRIATSEMSESDRKDTLGDVLREICQMVNYSRLYNANYHEYDQLYKLAPKLCWNLKNWDDLGLRNFPKVIEEVIDKIKYDFENPENDDFGKPIYKVGYTDMIYFPCLYKMNVPYSIRQYLDFVMCDECIPGNIFVTTNKGKKKIKTLFNYYDKNKLYDIKVKTFNEVTKQFEYKNIINVVNKGTKDVYEITTYGLNKMQATENHPFLTQNGWKRVDELIPNEDYVYLDNTYNQKCKLIPNDDQLQVIYGTSLGDGYLMKGNSKEYRLRITHGHKQYNYFKFKKDLLNCKYEHKTIGGYEAHSNIYNTTTRQFILDIKDKKDIINKLDARGLAVLYMDDGSCTQKCPYSTIKISCNNLTDEETLCLIDQFRKFDIIVENYPHYNDKGKKYNEIKMNTENGHKFLKLIAPYMINDCYYKNPESTGTYKWNNKFENFGGNIIKSIVKIKQDTVYDMEVEDNHNFLVSISSANPKGSSFIVHNCQDLSVLQQLFLKLLINYNTRLIAVGDKRPSYICICRS